MGGYYAERLSAERLRRCYDLAPSRIRRYLEAEIAFVRGHVHRSDAVLELGCGYGRVVEQLADCAHRVVGIDTSADNVILAVEELRRLTNCRFAVMDAVRLGLADSSFDVVLALQNGISAFAADQRTLLAESVRVTRPGGKVLFSSYSEKIWDARLEWFRLQVEHGLLGAIDWERTGDGVIVCADGFRATTVSAEQFRSLAARLGTCCSIHEVDESSVFCMIEV